MLKVVGVLLSMPSIVKNIRVLACCLSLILSISIPTPLVASAAQDSGSTGLEGRISAPPPSSPATISFPKAGAVFNEAVITVTGLCPSGTIVKVFKNNVFAGSAQCIKGSFSVQIDLFNGQNELIVRVYDDLDQAGPDSAVVTVNYNSPNNDLSSRISLTSNFAKRGASPGETLVWPLAIAGGSGPYAISVDWGDGSTQSILSQQFAGNFNVSHVYARPGIYTVIVRAVDKGGNVAFLQLVGVANGASGQQDSAGAGAGNSDANKKAQVKVVWWPLVVAIPLLILSFWLGSRHRMFVLKKKINEL